MCRKIDRRLCPIMSLVSGHCKDGEVLLKQEVEQTTGTSLQSCQPGLSNSRQLRTGTSRQTVFAGWNRSNRRRQQWLRGFGQNAEPEYSIEELRIVGC